MDYAHQRAVADNMISRYGASAILRRDSGDRPCRVFISDYMPHERVGKIINQTDRKALVSALGLTVNPDSEQDRLVTLDPSGNEIETLRIIAPIGKLEPAPGLVVYFELQVRR